ncbi:uncharacterized protein [Lolium perenne]|uniref:uncharacterized protein isoform X2 n=1 Tax=Lolium perenne TaxID=4522 RepID=UPI003A9A3FE9
MVEPLGSLYCIEPTQCMKAERASDIEASQQQRVWLVLLVIQVQNDMMNDFKSTEVDIGHRIHTSAYMPLLQNRSEVSLGPEVENQSQTIRCLF